MAYKVKDSEKKEGLKNFLTELVPSALNAGPVALKAKWDQREAVYECDPRYAGPRLFGNVTPYSYDVLGPVMRAVKDSVMAMLTGPATYCQALPLGATTQEAADVVESGVQTVAQLADIERTLDLTVHNAGMCGVGFLRARMDEDGLQIERIHPGDMVVSVHKGGTLRDAGVVGHRFYIPYWMFCQRVDEGLYPMLHTKETDDDGNGVGYGGGLQRFIGRRSQDEPTGYDASRNPANQAVLTSGSDFEDVRLYELLVRMEVEELPDDKKAPEGTRWYRVVWSDEASEAILCEPFPYPDPWYYDVRFHDEEVFWPVQSIAGRILPQCMHQSQMLNLAVTASMASVNRPVLATGVMGKKITTWNMGQLLQGQIGGKFEALPFDYNGTELLAFTNENDNRINKSAGVTESSLTGENLGAETATEVSKLAAGEEEAKGAKARYIGDFVEDLFEGIYNLCRWHQDVVKRVYGPKLDERFLPALRGSYKWRMTARSPGSSGTLLIAKLEKALTYALQPGSPYHAGRLIEAIVTSLNIGNLESYKKTPKELADEQQAIQQQKQMELMAAMAGGKAGGPPPGGPMQPMPPPSPMAAPKNGQAGAPGIA